MSHDLDGLFDRLAERPAPRRLDRLEADLAPAVSRARPGSAATPWRAGAIAVALVTGVGIGGVAALPVGAPSAAGPLLDGAGLAPSALLNPPR